MSLPHPETHLHGIPTHLRKHELGHGIMDAPRGALVTSTAWVWLKTRDALEGAEDEHVQYSYFGLPSASFFVLVLTFSPYLCQPTFTPSRSASSRPLLSARGRLLGITCLPAVHIFVWPRITLLLPPCASVCRRHLLLFNLGARLLLCSSVISARRQANCLLCNRLLTIILESSCSNG